MFMHDWVLLNEKSPTSTTFNNGQNIFRETLYVNQIMGLLRGGSAYKNEEKG